jgi:hypothetical protein
MNQMKQHHRKRRGLTVLLATLGLAALPLVGGCENNPRAEARLVDEVDELEEPGRRPITEPPPAMEYDPGLE